jgi:hypothetical protein
VSKVTPGGECTHLHLSAVADPCFQAVRCIRACCSSSYVVCVSRACSDSDSVPMCGNRAWQWHTGQLYGFPAFWRLLLPWMLQGIRPGSHAAADVVLKRHADPSNVHNVSFGLLLRWQRLSSNPVLHGHLLPCRVQQQCYLRRWLLLPHCFHSTPVSQWHVEFGHR